MCQTCCLGFSQHRQEGGISSSCPCKEALVMFTNLLIEAEQNGGIAQLQTTEDSWASVPLLRPLHVPTTSLTWEKPKPRLLQETNLLSPSGIIAMLSAASSVQAHPANCPSVTRYCSQIPNSGIPQAGYSFCVLPTSGCALWGRMVWAGQCKYYLKGPFHLPSSNSCKFYFKFVTFAGTAVFQRNI